MSCCKQAAMSNEYLPLDERLIAFGEEIYQGNVLEKYKTTKLWVFSFYRDDDLCDDCVNKFVAMNQWFENYNFFNDPIYNVKWVVEDEPDNNLIYLEMGFTKSPIHIFADPKGRIVDIISGFPPPEWLEKYILKVIKE